MTEPVRVERAALAALCNGLLVAAGATAGNAAAVVDHLIEADTLGLKSHGIIRVPQYLDDIAAGGIDPAAGPSFTLSAPGRAACDGGKGFGQVVGAAMAKKAIELARATGVAFVTGRHMGHTGRIGAYPEAIATAGLVGITVCSGPRSGHWVAPFGGRDGRLATNPIAYAFPVADGLPVVADFSTSVVPEGVVRSLRNRGLAAPAGALRDAAGRETTDPSVLYATPRGSIQPLGGPFGYRGTALGILVDVLAALLADDDAEDPQREGSNLAVLAISAGSGFAGRAERMARYVRSSPANDPAHPVMMPGEREQREAVRSGSGPILVDAPTWQSLCERGNRVQLAIPDSRPA
ncbi:MAG: Ldh family oxidoreductase [Rhizobiales bacterium]|nr:Ldh family oxidoreductase [Hyphomicrobiales bacterium]